MSKQTLRQALIHVVGGLGILAIPVQVLWLGLFLRNPLATEVDARQVWIQAERIRAGEPLYRPSMIPTPDVGALGPALPVEDAPYPPFVGSVVALLPPVSLLTFDRMWYVLMLAVFWAYAGLLGRLWTGRWGWWTSAVGHGTLLLTPGAWDGYAEGNIDPALWLLFAGALALPRLRGAGMVLWAGVKVHAVWPLSFACHRERWRVVRSAGAAVLLGVLIGLAAMGPGELVEAVRGWLDHVSLARSQGTFRITNVSLSFFVLRIFRWGPWEYSGGALPPLARSWLLFANIAAPLVAGFLTRRWKATSQYGTTMIAALLFAPLCWVSYLPLALAPMAASGRRDLSRSEDQTPE